MTTFEIFVVIDVPVILATSITQKGDETHEYNQ